MEIINKNVSPAQSGIRRRKRPDMINPRKIPGTKAVGRVPESTEKYSHEKTQFIIIDRFVPPRSSDACCRMHSGRRKFGIGWQQFIVRAGTGNCFGRKSGRQLIICIIRADER